MICVRSHVWPVLVAAGALLTVAPLESQRRGGEPSAAERAAGRRYNIGIVRADGRLIPFAQYDRGEFRIIWSAATGGTPQIPISFDDIERNWWGRLEPTRDWSLYSLPAGVPQPIAATKPESVFLGCRTFPALATNMKTPERLPPPYQAPYPKAGFATTMPVTFEAVELLRDGVEWDRVASAVAKDFTRFEDTSLSQMEWGHPYGKGERERRRVEIEAVWHAKDSRLYYVEASRRYPDRNPPKGKPPCELVTFVSGWFWDSPDETIVPRTARAQISYCHMEQVKFIWPLGIIREADKRYVVAQHSGWTSESYIIAELQPSRGQVLSKAWVSYGDCFR